MYMLLTFFPFELSACVYSYYMITMNFTTKKNILKLKNSCILRQLMALENGKLEHKAFIICINDTFYTMCHSVFKFDRAWRICWCFVLFFFLIFSSHFWLHICAQNSFWCSNASLSPAEAKLPYIYGWHASFRKPVLSDVHPCLSSR